ncbi:hypothetical protein [Ekhidna sp.]
MRSGHLLLLILLALYSTAQSPSTAYPKQIMLDSQSEGRQKKASLISREKNASRIKSIASASNDSLTLELLYLNNGEYWSSHVLVGAKKSKWVNTYQLDYDFGSSVVDKIVIHSSDKLFFSIHLEKHNAWSSNYEKGKSLNKGTFLLNVIDEKLHYKYFKESVERSGVDYRTGSFSEKTFFQKLKIEGGHVQFFYPKDSTRRNYKIVGAELNLEEN